ncbi:hypothetical protein KKH23_06990 [Patescibacteria group bacterium]|nr:hypothetical protein [Patescibacteria group bacterium]
MAILGGYEALVYTSSGVSKSSGDATNVGVMTRINPTLDPGNISVRGTGKRGLYDILLGMREPKFTFDMLFTDKDFIITYQDGLTAIPWLHLRFPGSPDSGLTFENVHFNRSSVESRHNEAISATIEAWSESLGALGDPDWQAVVSTPYRWLDSSLSIAATPETEWWSWRYESANNLQRLGNVDDGGTRSLTAKQREVSGLIVMDLDNFSEYTDLMNLVTEEDKFNITIQVDSEDLLNAYCRWGTLEAPAGPEDLIAKRFPFTALDLS